MVYQVRVRKSGCSFKTEDTYIALLVALIVVLAVKGDAVGAGGSGEEGSREDGRDLHFDRLSGRFWFIEKAF